MFETPTGTISATIQRLVLFRLFVVVWINGNKRPFCAACLRSPMQQRESGDMEPPQDATAKQQQHVHAESVPIGQTGLGWVIRLLWKRKYLILPASVILALIVGASIFFGPREYKITYSYTGFDLDNAAYEIFLQRFYSTENIARIITALKAQGLDKYAAKVAEANKGSLGKLFEFGVGPPYMDLSKIEITDPVEAEEIRKLPTQMLSITIAAESKADLPRVASVLRSNIQDIMPMYSLKQEAIRTICNLRRDLSEIGGQRFDLKLTLKTNNALARRLRKIDVTADGKEDKITIQFNISDKGEFMPLPYQIRAVEAKIISLEEGINANDAKYDYYKELCLLWESVLEELNKHEFADYTIQRYQSFLTSLIPTCQKEEIRDYLTSYIRGIDNIIHLSVPIVNQPRIYATGRKTIKKTAIAFVIAFAISSLVALASEALGKSEAA